jgi:hypothetical protein
MEPPSNLLSGLDIFIEIPFYRQASNSRKDRSPPEKLRSFRA